MKCNRSKKSNAWLSDEAVKAKRDRRRHERRWCKTKSETDRAAYRKSCRAANELIINSRKNFYAELISGASDNMRKLWRAVNSILHPAMSAGITSLTSSKLAEFFMEKVAGAISAIRTQLITLNIDRIPDICYTGEKFCDMTPVTDLEVCRLISSMPNKTSPLDSMSVNIIKSLADFLSPYIARMANLSFSTGIFPNKFKTAQVTPILKKQGLDIDIDI